MTLPDLRLCRSGPLCFPGFPRGQCRWHTLCLGTLSSGLSRHRPRVGSHLKTHTHTHTHMGNVKVRLWCVYPCGFMPFLTEILIHMLSSPLHLPHITDEMLRGLNPESAEVKCLQGILGCDSVIQPRVSSANPLLSFIYVYMDSLDICLPHNCTQYV